MSFMFKPLAYDDPNAFNTIKLNPELEKQFCRNSKDTAEAIISDMLANNKHALALDGYISADYSGLIEALKLEAEKKDIKFVSLDMKEIYKSQKEIDELTAESLPLNYEDDPVLLFGKLYNGTVDDLIADSAAGKIEEMKKGADIIAVYGVGSACRKIRSCFDAIGFVDVTPKVCAIRAREAKYVNIGDESPRPFKL